MNQVLFLLFITAVSTVCSRRSLCLTNSQLRSYVVFERFLSKMVTNRITLNNYTLSLLNRHHGTLLNAVLDIDDRSQCLQNVFDKLSLSRRLMRDWPVVVILIRMIAGGTLELPTMSPDKVGGLGFSSMTALVRLQEVYNISTETLISWGDNGVNRHSKLTGPDCFEIGVYYFRLQHYKRAVEWLLAALQRTEHFSRSRHRILEYLHLAYCFIGNKKRSALILRLLLESQHQITPNIELLKHKTTVATHTCKEVARRAQETLYGVKGRSSVHFTENLELCRKREQPETDKQLKCRLLHYNHPHIKICPFKIEELHLDPPLLKFHDVIHTKEIESVVKDFRHQTHHAILDYRKGTDHHQDTQYNVWLELANPRHTLPRRLSLRAARMTNMRLEHAEETMLASYGVGGEIKLHTDLGDDDFDVTKEKTRADYATVMFYLNEVEEGGHTIFPNIGQTVVPEKGNALMWFNRFPDWTPNLYMFHSGCPVLKGSKWIITKWLHVKGQDYPLCFPGKEGSYKYYYL